MYRLTRRFAAPTVVRCASLTKIAFWRSRRFCMAKKLNLQEVQCLRSKVQKMGRQIGQKQNAKQSRKKTTHWSTNLGYNLGLNLDSTELNPWLDPGLTRVRTRFKPRFQTWFCGLLLFAPSRGDRTQVQTWIKPRGRSCNTLVAGYTK